MNLSHDELLMWLLREYWRGNTMGDPVHRNRCRQLADLVLAQLPGLAGSTIVKEPALHADALQTAIEAVQKHSPVGRSLIRQLLGQKGPTRSTPPTEASAVDTDRSEHSRAADLEIWLQRGSGNSHALTITFTAAGSTAIDQFVSGDIMVDIDMQKLLESSSDPEAYGSKLTSMLCADTQVREAMIAARERARGAGVPLRIRLRLNADDPILPGVRWELLRDPASNSFLCTNAEVCFSRFSMSNDGVAITIPNISRLKVLLAIAAPSDLQRYNLPQINAVAEAQAVAPMLTGVDLRTITQTSLAVLSEHLLQETHVLYLICHGDLRDNKPMLYFSDSNGKTAPTHVSDLVQRIQNLDRRPSLIMLTACQSAGLSHRPGDGLIAAGPQLARAGIGAVLAMHDNVPMSVIHQGIPVLFSELQRHGVIDRAVAAMRNILAAHKNSWWQPVLYLRLRDGHVFHIRRGS
jgi:hypothetical protein